MLAFLHSQPGEFTLAVVMLQKMCLQSQEPPCCISQGIFVKFYKSNNASNNLAFCIQQLFRLSAILYLYFQPIFFFISFIFQNLFPIFSLQSIYYMRTSEFYRELLLILCVSLQQHYLSPTTLRSQSLACSSRSSVQLLQHILYQ